MLAALMVTTSLKIPQMLRVTTLVRFRRVYSDVVMKNARHPGKSKMRKPRTGPFWDERFCKAWMRFRGPSTGKAMTIMLKNMMGERRKIDEKGFEVAGCRRRRIWVSDHLNPAAMEDDMMRTKPRTLKAVSPATIMTTPTVMVRMMTPSFHEGFSSLKRNAKRRTKPRTEDLHIAVNVC